MRLTSRRPWLRFARRSYPCILQATLVASFHPTQPFLLAKPFRQFFSTRHLHSAPTATEIQMTHDIKTIIHAAIDAVSPVTAVQNHLTTTDGNTLRVGMRDYPVQEYDQILLVAFGKASSAMATAVLDRLEEMEGLPPLSGVVIVKDGHATVPEQERLSARNVRVREASHPVPDQRSVDASNEILQLVQQPNGLTLLITCISGGGSALFCAPSQDLTLDDLQATNTALLQSGWNIHDMNVVRKRLDQGKGGRLAAAAYPGDVLSLILSDVLGDPLDLIASGPTVCDTSQWKDAWKLVQTLPPRSLPPRVERLLQQGVDGLIEDSPSEDHPVFQQCENVLVGNNALAVDAAAKQAETLGYHPIVLGTRFEGEATEVARFLVSMAQHAKEGPNTYSFVTDFPVALILGGETTVSLPPQCTGKGGRNQELALQAAVLLQQLSLRNVVLASVGTDGTDGPTDAAGR
ncbi:hypothetical protein FisN_3Hh472 [Fistulifera solaris]|uniref:Glycerate 2-kinase n=1 Tax=Fistulifera solaris TaxID=1519565 RepID=A0A1Z5K843_FISSO|nr:hypothetical protein FisN_3Hh472 [Fistulifera solaris]|eukprot:GAX22322.1 hypothetical protein FisN_3Hh472 [Fistulifera solaris]